MVRSVTAPFRSAIGNIPSPSPDRVWNPVRAKQHKNSTGRPFLPPGRQKKQRGEWEQGFWQNQNTFLHPRQVHPGNLPVKVQGIKIRHPGYEINHGLQLIVQILALQMVLLRDDGEQLF